MAATERIGSGRTAELYEATGISARVRRAVSVSVPDNSLTIFTFDTVEHDTGGLFSGGDPTRLTFPSAGYYSVGGAIFYDVNTLDRARVAELRLNGSTFPVVQSSKQFSGGVSQGEALSVSQILKLDAADYIELGGFQQSGSAISTIVGPMSMVMWAQKLNRG